MKYRIAFGLIAFVLGVQGQYPADEDHEELFQSPEPINTFARVRPIRSGYNGGGGAEILQDSNLMLSNQQIGALPNYGGGPAILPIKQEPGYGSPQILPIKEAYANSPVPQIQPIGYGAAPIKQEPFSGGYGSQTVPIKQEAFPIKPVPQNPGFGGGYGVPQKPLIQNQGQGYGNQFKQPISQNQGFGNQFKEPISQNQGYGNQFKQPISQNQGYGNQFKQPISQPQGYNSGSGISFSNSGGYGNQGHHGHSHGGYNNKPQGFGNQHQHQHQEDSYAKPPVVQEGYGTPLAPPPIKAPTGYGR